MKNILYYIALGVSAILLGGAGISHFAYEIPLFSHAPANAEPSSQADFRKTVRTNNGGTTVHTYSADISAGVIGVCENYPVDDLYDNIFHFMLDEAPVASDVVWLSYDLKGVQDHAAVARSINTRQSVGGCLVHTGDEWTKQMERINGEWLHEGDNVIRFSLPENAAWHYDVRDIRIVVEKKNGSGGVLQERNLIVNQTSTKYYGNKAYLKGFLTGAGADHAQVFAGDEPLDLVQGEYEYVAEKPEQTPLSWYLELRAVYPDGAEIHKTVVFDTRVESGSFMPAEARGLSQARPFEPEGSGSFEAFGAGIELPEHAIKNKTTISITALRDVDMPALDPDMVNVTNRHKGFRFLPDGIRFEKNVRLRIEYDPELIPDGYTEKDIRTYYFDDRDRRWKMTPFDSIAGSLVISSTNHFTDYINGIIKVPESPQTQGYKPTEIKDLKASDASAGIVPLAPPTANNMGTANLGFPLKVPAGRHGMQPQLAIQYNSEGGNGWLGMGWDLSIPSVTIDTRWGVPRYDAGLETETYLMGGDQLIPLAHRDVPVARVADRQYYPRVEGAFQKIIRHGNSPKTYYWEVVSKEGVHNYYGGTSSGLDSDAVLTDDDGHIAQWYLGEVKDANGNFMRYRYKNVTNPTVTSAIVPGGVLKGKQLYIDHISYTGNGNEEGKYEIRFIRDRQINADPASLRRDASVNCRQGFEQAMADRLSRVEILFDNNPVRSYELKYKEGAFDKTLLSEIIEIDREGKQFYSHKFDYYDEVRQGTGYLPYKPLASWTVPSDNLHGNIPHESPGFTPKTSLFSGSASEQSSFGGSVTLGAPVLCGTKYLSGGINFSSSDSESKGLNALIDIDGDGLPDKVYRKNNGAIVYRKNLGGAVSGQQTFSAERPIAGLDNYGITDFSHSTSSNSSIGWEADVFVFIGNSGTDGTSTTDIFFGDFNGDGLTDLVANNEVYFNRINAAGYPEFSPESDGTPNPVSSGAAVDQSLLVIDPNEEAKLNEKYPLHDVVRTWRAPYDGKIDIDAPVNLVNIPGPASQHYLKKDGVRVAIQFKGTERWGTTIAFNDFSIHTPGNVSGIDVKQGDRVYFRVHSIYDGAFDQVQWNPVITYNDIPNNEMDANGRKANHFAASEDFLLSSPQMLTLPYKGTIQVKGIFVKPRTSDSLTLELVKSHANKPDSIILQRGFTWNDSLTTNIDTSFTVEAMDELAFTVKSATNIDWSTISFVPQIVYTQAVDTAGNSIGGLDYVYCPSVDFTMLNEVWARTKAFIPDSTGTLTVSPYLIKTLGSPVQPYDPPYTGEITLSIKGTNRLYAETTFNFSNTTIISNSGLPLKAYQLPANEPVYVEYHVKNRRVLDSLQLLAFASFNGADVPVNPGIFTRLEEKEYLLGPLYRGWGQFVYKGNAPFGQQKIDEAELKLDNALLNDPPDFGSNDTTGLSNLYDPSKARFIIMLANLKNKAWEGYDQSTWVKADAISSSRMGRDNVKIDLSLPGGGTTGLIVPNKMSKSSSDSWSYSGQIPNVPISGSYNTSSSSTETLIDHMDMNGDRIPDIIGEKKTQFSTMRGGWEPLAIDHKQSGTHNASADAESMSLGGSFINASFPVSGNSGGGSPKVSIAQPAWVIQGSENCKKAPENATTSIGISINPNVSFGSNDDNTDETWLDLNGDGLPDKVFKNGMVALNLGYRFAAPSSWGFSSIRKGVSQDFSAGGGLGINVWYLSFSSGFSVNRNDSEVAAALQDINGDGLVDILELGDPLKIRLNTGAGFSDPLDWNGVNSIEKSASTGESANFGGTLCIHLLPFFPVVKLCVGLNGSTGSGVSRTNFQISDIDGDGYPDLLQSDDDGHLDVHSSTIGRTNLLKTVSRPMGSSFTLQYDSIGNTYDLPQYKWVLAEVEVFDGLTGDGADRMKTTFAYDSGMYNRRERDFYGFKTVTTRQLNTGNNNDAYRTVIQTFINDNYYQKGLLAREITHDGNGNPFTETVNTYELRDPATGGPFDPLNETGRGFPALTETKKLFYEGANTAGLQNRTTYAYNNIGNIVEYTDYGDGTPGDVLTAQITYHDLPVPYIKSMPESIEVKDNNGRLRYREADIDGKGNVTQIRQFLESGDAAAYDMGYDVYGNLTNITRPQNRDGQRLHYEYVYDDAVHTYVTEVKDGYGYVSKSAYNYAFGQVIESIDINKQRIVYSLDAKGRIDTIIGPYELAAGKPFTIVNEYHPEAAVPFAKTRHFDPANNGEIVTVTFMDGLQRPVQVKKTGSLFIDKNQPDQAVMIVSGRVKFDAFGRAVENFYPVTEAVGGSNEVFDTTFDPIPPTVTTYDVLDRKTSVTLPDGAKTTTEYAIGNDNSGYTCFKSTETDPLNNGKVTYIDIRGRTRAVQEVGPIWTDFRYNLVSELLLVTDNEGNKTEYTYDQLGRRLSAKHPDAGLTEFTYDIVGNLIAKTTPNTRVDNESIKYTYEFERLVQIDYPKNYQNMVRYTYGKPDDKHNRAGRIWLQEDASGGQEFFFGPLGEVVKNIRTVLVSNIRLITYVTEYRYDTWNRIDTMIYPDGEIVKYRYNLAGKLKSMSSHRFGLNTDFVKRMGYDKFEQRAFLRYGNDTETQYAYEDERRRLRSMTVTNADGRTFMDNHYEYDAVGNILTLNNTAPPKTGEMGGPTSYTYKYDKLYRLTDASGSWSGPVSQESFTLNMQYDDLHNILKKSQKHLRDGQAQPATSYNQAYEYDPTRPNVPVKIGNLSYQFDANGNMTGWAEDITNRNRFIRWDEENRIRDIWEDGYVSQYTYDAGGERIVKSHGGMSIAYTNGAPVGMINHRDNFTTYPSAYVVGRSKQLTKHYYIEGQRILTKIAAGTLYYPLQGIPGEYITAGNINYQKKMELLASADGLGSPAPPTPGNPPLPPVTDVPTYQPGQPNQYYYVLPQYTNDNVPAGFNLNKGSEQSYESNMYYFHPDHLGSTGYVTGFNGKLRQHVEYLPFGETFVEEHLNTDPTQPYLYNAKEYDAETRLYYYGARYYDPKLSIWASVDPVAEETPG